VAPTSLEFYWPQSRSSIERTSRVDMWAKLLLGVLFLAMIGSAVHFDPVRKRALLGAKVADGPRLRLMTWNIGYASLAAGDRYALGATFRFRKDAPEIVLVSAHADAFNAARRRSFTGEVVDWARERPANAIVFIAGDFNFEVNTRDRSNLFTDNLKHDSEAYSYILKYFRDLGRDAGWTALNERRIDYIFGPPEVALLRRAEVLKGAAVGHMDHWPLLIEVAL
jgi:endonuclease/exonuclease/phosphatase family metal-dependent hydrolase